ncbi:MAG: hypothetical protein ABIH11_00895 [Candidatus Altiarchaeota archaeon]
MAKLSKAAIERMHKQKTDIESKISDYQEKIHELRNSSESRLSKTHKLKQYQTEISHLKRQLSSL